MKAPTPLVHAPAWSPQASQLNACGIRTRVLQGGAHLKATEAFVFVHGNPGSSEDWRDLMLAMAPHTRVIAFDMPGFGQADKPADDPDSVEGGAALLTEAMRQLGVLRRALANALAGGAPAMADELACLQMGDADRQRETFPKAAVVELPRSGHFPFADDPEGVAQAVVPFLRQQLSGREGPGVT